MYVIGIIKSLPISEEFWEDKYGCVLVGLNNFLLFSCYTLSLVKTCEIYIEAIDLSLTISSFSQGALDFFFAGNW